MKDRFFVLLQPKGAMALLVLILCLAFSPIIPSARATENTAADLPAGPYDRSPYTIDYVDFRLILGEHEEICRSIAQGLRERDLIPKSYGICGVPFPAGDRNFELMPPWRTLDPAAHLGVVKEIFYWANMKKNIVGVEAYQKQRYSKTAIPELMERQWRTSEARIMALIGAGRVYLQVNRYDYNNDGTADTLYRMTHLRVPVHYGRNGEPVTGKVDFSLKPCGAVLPGWTDTPWIYAVEKGETRFLLPLHYALVRVDLYLFRYRKKTYRISGTSGQVNKFVAGEMFRSVCSFQPLREGQ